MQLLPKRATLAALEAFESKWNSKYSYAIKSWRQNWDELTVFFDFPLEIRQIIYTTNLIGNLNEKLENTQRIGCLFLMMKQF